MTDRQDSSPDDAAFDEAEAPLESDPADWQEQHQDVPGDPDERR